MVSWSGFGLGCPRWLCVRAALRCAAFLVCCGLLFACGCKKKERVYTSRANDEAYVASLMSNQALQMAAAKLRMETSAKMTQCVARVQAGLPEGAGAEALRAALAGDGEWLELEALAVRQDEESEQILSEAKKLVQSRMMEEQQAQLDVEAGRAEAADAPKKGKVRR